tara:strand:+ start:435 stop:1472 length:1038 start_codon:yes stop_codon:yes gene_type:complete
MFTRKAIVIPFLIIILLITSLFSVGMGALSISINQIIAIIVNPIGLDTGIHFEPIQEAVFWSIRLPRIVAAILIGGALAISGACMQGLFRNPLADPGLIGISSGASLSASIVIVLGLSVGFMGQYFLSTMAFLGAAVVAIIVYNISKTSGKTVVATMLLAGIAFTALAEAGRGYLSLISSESELRSVTFWMLGSLGGANWNSIFVLLPFIMLPTLFILGLGKRLNAFALGEYDAAYMGVNVARLKTQIILFTTMAVGASVAVSGLIGFVGLIVPHTLRMAIGPDHKLLLPSSILLGAILLVVADLLCRTIIAPIEIPIGIITAALGAPLFISILIREKKKRQLLL